MATLVPKVSTKSAAPGQYLGYSLQDVRLCDHLMTASAECIITLEHVDDTAIHYPGGETLLEQSKSALSGNPIGDGSVELWKCFANWARLCVEGTIDPAKTDFRLYVCPAKQGALAELLHAATTDAEAKAVLAKVAKKVTAANKLKGCNPLISDFVGSGDDICVQIILNFRLIVETDPLEPIRERLRLLVLDTALDEFVAHAIGTAKNQIATLIRDGKTPAIQAGAFRKRVVAFIRKHGALGLLAPTTEQPADALVSATLAASPTFVRQLLKVEMKQEHIVRAVSDYLRSDADQTFWAAGGHIVEESLNELHEGLEAHFQITRDEIEDLHGSEAAEKRGRQIYRRCITHQAPLEGRSVPSYFIPGTFNMMADSARVGWHPDYADFFAGE